jgi:hypothetical protein
LILKKFLLSDLFPHHNIYSNVKNSDVKDHALKLQRLLNIKVKFYILFISVIFSNFYINIKFFITHKYIYRMINHS